MSKNNNFDLIRLIAALQVVVVHSYEHLELQSPYLDIVKRVIAHFPGVPIFFTISVFLIYASFKKNDNIGRYLKNRFLRIYPGLWLSFILTVFILGVYGFVNYQSIRERSFIFWVIGQTTFFQFYTPEMLRGFGTGTPNGSLWTIPIEVTFYAFIPLFFWLRKQTSVKANFFLLAFICASLITNQVYKLLVLGNEMAGYGSVASKLFKTSLFPYLFYFLLGSMIFENWDKIKKYYINKGFYWLAIYFVYIIIFSYIFNLYQPSYWPDIAGIGSIFLLSNTIIAVAFTLPTLSYKILRNNDISYGVYLFHMLIINCLIQSGVAIYSNTIILSLVVVASVCFAYISWKLIEKPALGFKVTQPKVFEDSNSTLKSTESHSK